MHQFFVAPGQIQEARVSIAGDDVNHIRNVLRMKVGDLFCVSDGHGHAYTCRITQMGKERVEAVIVDMYAPATELPVKIFLFQGLPKSDKMDWIVQKAVELGAHAVIPVCTKRSVVRLDGKKAQAKCARWNAIAKAAAEQSGRQVVPEVALPMEFAQALSYAETIEEKLFPYECETGMDATRAIVGGIRPGKSVAVFIGPEGGFSGEEVRRAREAGFSTISLGGRILRTETAGLFVLSVLGYLLDAGDATGQ